MDKIIIKDLEVYAYHGFAPEEKKLGQLFLISVELSTDLELAANSGNLDATINYAEVCNLTQTILLSQNFDLIETAAMKVIEGIFHQFRLVKSVRVLLKKPWAPMGHHLRYVAIELERGRWERNEW